MVSVLLHAVNGVGAFTCVKKKCFLDMYVIYLYKITYIKKRPVISGTANGGIV